MASFMGLLGPEENWEHGMKMELYSPQNSLNADSSNSSQSSDCSMPSLQLCCGPREQFLHANGSLADLMSLEKSKFLKKIPSTDFEKILALDGDPFAKKTQTTYKSPAHSLNSYFVASERSLNSSMEWSDSSNSNVYCARTEQPMFFIGNEGLHRQFSSETLGFAKSATSSPLSSPLQSDKESPPPQKISKRQTKHNRKYGHILWKFLLELLMNTEYHAVICWTGHRLAYKVRDKIRLSELWSMAKPRQSKPKISYETITRGIRSYKQKQGQAPIISHAQESNFTYVFNESYRDELAKEAGMSFSDLINFARRTGIDC